MTDPRFTDPRYSDPRFEYPRLGDKRLDEKSARVGALIAGTLLSRLDSVCCDQSQSFHSNFWFTLFYSCSCGPRSG